MDCRGLAADLLLLSSGVHSGPSLPSGEKGRKDCMLKARKLLVSGVWLVSLPWQFGEGLAEALTGGETGGRVTLRLGKLDSPSGEARVLLPLLHDEELSSPASAAPSRMLMCSQDSHHRDSRPDSSLTESA